jgi:peroxiredoxin
MKKLFAGLVAILPAAAFAQAGQYTINGSLGNYNAPAKVYLQYVGKDKKVVIDSATLVSGKFTFTGQVTDDPIMAGLMFNPKGDGMKYDDEKRVFLENGTIAVTGTETMGSATVSGTQTNIDEQKLGVAMAPIDTAWNGYEAKDKAATDQQKQTPEFQQEMNKLEKDIEQQEKAVEQKFIQDNPDSYISVIELQSISYSSDYKEIAPLFDALTPRVKGTVRGKHFAELLPHIKAVAMGATAPEFTEADTSGKMVSLSSFRGKYVLIDFWASWCGPCRHENPNVVKAFNQYKGKNFTIIGVSLDRPGAKDKWLAAIHKDGLTWTHVSDLQFWDSKTAALYAVKGIPQNFLIDPNGKIIAKNLRGDDLENELELIFGKDRG